MHTERVKRLASNEIELGMKIPTIESRASNIPKTKGITSVVITVRPIKIFIVLDHVVSARLTFFDDIVLYELYDLVTKRCSES